MQLEMLNYWSIKPLAKKAPTASCLLKGENLETHKRDYSDEGMRW